MLFFSNHSLVFLLPQGIFVLKGKFVVKVQIAIDGPVSSGKTTIGSRLAAELGYLFVDTGLMYRAVGWKINTERAPKEEWGKIAQRMKFSWKGKRHSPEIYLDGTNVTNKLFSPEISLISSKVATDAEVRKYLVQAQRKIAARRKVVMVGRDIGTVVLPKAKMKIFLTASIEARSKRRYNELRGKGVAVTLSRVKAEMLKRDRVDSTRKDSPLKPALDSIRIDATTLSPTQIVSQIISIAKSRE